MKTCFIPLSHGKWAQVSLEDSARVAEFKWTYGEHNGAGYAYKTGGLRLHRFLCGAKPGEEVDHVNGDPLDNRRENLRLCSREENSRNTRKWKSETHSRFKGVSRISGSKKWRAYISSGRKQLSLGSFDSEEAAAKAYDHKARELFGKFARPNFS